MVNEQNAKNNEDDLIIYHPHALHPLRKGVEMTVTVIGWFIWAVLCRPLFLAFLWFLGFEIFYEHMIRLGGIKALIDFAYLYLGTIFAMYVLIRSWNFYNARKFRNKNKRKNVKDVTAADLEDYFKFAPDTIEKAQGWKNTVVGFSGLNQILIKEESKPGSQPDKGYFKSG
jgi:biofilm PGA synthesis protein PgaD